MSTEATSRTTLDVVRDLRGVTSEMLDAAKQVKVARLQELGERRGALVFELEVLLSSDPPRPDDPTALQEEYLELRDLERRLVRVSSLVLRAFARAGPGETQTYGRAGRVIGG